MSAGAPTRLSGRPSTGVDAFIAGVSKQAEHHLCGGCSREKVILRLGEEYAGIRLQDLHRPRRFLRQVAGAPPLRLGSDGFRAEVVDDADPARHYTAFVFVGYWLPNPLAVGLLWLWEIAGFFRYGGRWSANDMRSGRIGVRHGRWVRQLGPTVLPALIAADLAKPPNGVRPRLDR